MDEQRIAQVLMDAGGPPELAPQLAALAATHNLDIERVLEWIHFHLGGEWSGHQFNLWCEKYKHSASAIERMIGAMGDRLQ